MLSAEAVKAETLSKKCSFHEKWKHNTSEINAMCYWPPSPFQRWWLLVWMPFWIWYNFNNLKYALQTTVSQLFCAITCSCKLKEVYFLNNTVYLNNIFKIDIRSLTFEIMHCCKISDVDWCLCQMALEVWKYRNTKLTARLALWR